MWIYILVSRLKGECKRTLNAFESQATSGISSCSSSSSMFKDLLISLSSVSNSFISRFSSESWSSPSTLGSLSAHSIFLPPLPLPLAPRPLLPARPPRPRALPRPLPRFISLFFSLWSWNLWCFQADTLEQPLARLPAPVQWTDTCIYVWHVCWFVHMNQTNFVHALYWGTLTRSSSEFDLCISYLRHISSARSSSSLGIFFGMEIHGSMSWRQGFTNLHHTHRSHNLIPRRKKYIRVFKPGMI